MRHMVGCLVIAGAMIIVGLATASVQGPASKERALLPTDTRQRHVEKITDAKHDYVVPFRGTVDGVMTRMPISYAAYKQGFQPNLWVRMENVGDTDVANPWLTANGTGDWRTIAKIAAEATRGCVTEADKARAIWEWAKSHRYHACTWDNEVSDAVKVHNVYGYTLCGNEAMVLSDLWRAAGLKTRRGYPVGHVVAEAWYDGEFHLLDSDEHVMCLRRDNKTIASEAEVVRDHDLMKRTHTYSIGSGDSPLTDQFSASLYGYEGTERKGEHGGLSKHKLFFALRPGEALEWRFDHVGKEYTYGTDPEPGKPVVDGMGNLKAWGGLAYEDLRNGKWVYRVPLEKPAVWRKGAQVVENVAEGTVCPVEGKTMRLVWKMQSPYVFVGTTLKCRHEGGPVRLSFSPDGKTWEKVAEGAESGFTSAAIDRLISTRGKPTYEYYVALEAEGPVTLQSVEFDNDVQMSLLGMPQLVVGDNKLQYTDETPGPREVRVTHAWIERTDWQPPKAPAGAVFPADGATVEGTKFALQWEPAEAVGAESKIADYQVQVCERPDMRWVLSPNFDKRVSLTPSKGKAEWMIPFTGLLNPGTTYYWRVRALDGHGVWGPWSKRFAFKCEAPGVPLNVRAKAQQDGTVEVAWEANPEGRAPVAYKVYGSNEQGFTASDVEYIVAVGRGFCDTMEEYKAKDKKGDDPFYGNVKTPSNLVTKTGQTRLVVAGPGVALPNANQAFYRVVAVDAKGNESGASDYAALPRPMAYTKAVTEGQVGEAYRYAPKALYSIGHYACNGSYNAAYWHREKLAWTLEKGPQWLKLENGILTGTPPAAGRYEITLKVTNNKSQQAQQAFALTVK
ncbi:MAG: putative Ig domain-containing protein [Armatimonadia bacterium]